MPPEIATAGVFERWEWMADNGVKPLSEFTRRWRGNKAREMFMAQIPVPGQWS